MVGLYVGGFRGDGQANCGRGRALEKIQLHGGSNWGWP